MKTELFKFVFEHNVSQNVGCYMNGIISDNHSGQEKPFSVFRLITRKSSW